MKARRHTPRAIERSVIAAVKAADWLTDSDAAVIRSCRRLAETLDDLYMAQSDRLLPTVQADLAGKTTYTMQTFLRALEQAGLTAKARADLGYGPATAEDDPLAAIQSEASNVVALNAD